eukprot:TRINITY_DN16607_c0_g1_i1.p2 TRINITY_DN16607_c0_g1~~TRINITY_DN16607_c0_g1_i1.p2  ORF type:complete len:193 (-),score=-16.43 TRINITY_DN16607_c0_g1_i1:1-579(-)
MIVQGCFSLNLVVQENYKIIIIFYIILVLTIIRCINLTLKNHVQFNIVKMCIVRGRLHVPTTGRQNNFNASAICKKIDYWRWNVIQLILLLICFELYLNDIAITCQCIFFIVKIQLKAPTINKNPTKRYFLIKCLNVEMQLRFIIVSLFYGLLHFLFEFKFNKFGHRVVFVGYIFLPSCFYMPNTTQILFDY